jgi:hypothetical protein
MARLRQNRSLPDLDEIMRAEEVDRRRGSDVSRVRPQWCGPRRPSVRRGAEWHLRPRARGHAPGKS